MKYDRSVKDYILSSVEISDVVSRRVDLKRVGASMRGLCPFHSEKTPSFYVSDSRQSYYCFGCKNHGNAIDFVMQMENLEFLEALETLADRYNLNLSSYLIESYDKKDVSIVNKIYEMNKAAARFFYAELKKSRLAREYFEDREINEATIKSFGLGYSPDSWDSLLKYLKSLGYTETDALSAGLASKSENGRVYDRFRNRIIFPIFDYRSRVLGFGARAFAGAMPKYLNSPESLVFQKSKILYGDRMSRKASKSDSVLLVEGYMDLLQAYQNGFYHVLASMGTALTREQVSHIVKRYKNVLFAYDMDDAGRNAINRSIPLLEEHGVNVKIVNIHPAKDPDEFLKRFGKLAFEERLLSAENTISFSLENIRKKYDLKDAKERYDFVMESIAMISSLCSSVEAELYLQELAKISSIPYDRILSEYNVFDKSSKKEKIVSSDSMAGEEIDWDGTYSKSEGKLDLDISLYEKQLIAFAIKDKKFALRIFEASDGEFLSEGLSTIFSVLMMFYSTQDEFDPVSISEDLDLDSAISLQEIFDDSEAEFTEDELNFLIARWTSEKIKMEIENIDLEIKRLSFLSDEESNIKSRILRKKRSTLLKTAYNNRKK